MQNIKSRKLVFFTNKEIRKKSQIAIVLPHGPLYDFLSFMCWYSVAKHHEFLDAALIFVGRPHNQFKSWAQKFNFPIYFMNKFHNLIVTEKRFKTSFDASYILCMYNVFFVQENESIFDNSFTNENIIFRKHSSEQAKQYPVFSTTHDELVPIVKFNFANEDLIASMLINNDATENPFLVERKAPEESVNEARLELLYRRCRELYRNLMEGYYEKEI